MLRAAVLAAFACGAATALQKAVRVPRFATARWAADAMPDLESINLPGDRKNNRIQRDLLRKREKQLLAEIEEMKAAQSYKAVGNADLRAKLLNTESKLFETREQLEEMTAALEKVTNRLQEVLEERVRMSGTFDAERKGLRQENQTLQQELNKQAFEKGKLAQRQKNMLHAGGLVLGSVTKSIFSATKSIVTAPVVVPVGVFRFLFLRKRTPPPADQPLSVIGGAATRYGVRAVPLQLD